MPQRPKKSKRNTTSKVIHGHGAAAAPAAVQKKPPRTMVVTAEARPDRDAGFDFVVASDKQRQRATIPLGEGVKVSGFVAVVEQDKAGAFKVKRHKVLNTAGLKQLMESKTFRSAKLLETDPFSIGSEGASTGALPPNNEYIPTMGGPFSKQLYLFDYLDMHAKAFEAKNHNPLAKQAIDIITMFTVGKGVKILFRNAELQKAWDQFEQRNDLQAFLQVDSDTLTWAGELMTEWGHFMDGMPRLSHIDPSTVWEIVTDPRDIREVFYYHQQFPTQWQLVYHPGDKVSEYVVNDIPGRDVLHVKINAAPGEKRGRSDLFPVLGWLKRFKDYFDAKITKAQIEESWVLKKKINGSAADVDALFADPTISQVPPPGSVLIENEAIDTQYMTPTTSSDSGRDTVGDAIRSIVATGLGLPPEFLGAGGLDATRAAALVKSEPATRKFEARQQLMERYLRRIAERWMEEGMAPGLSTFRLPTQQVRKASMGRLKAAVAAMDFAAVAKEAAGLLILGGVKEPIDQGFEVIFPEIGTEDRSIKIGDIYKAQLMGSFSKERSSTMVAKELGVTDFNYHEEQETIREEREAHVMDPLYDPTAGDPAAAGFGNAGRPKPGQPGGQNPAGGVPAERRAADKQA